MQVKIYLHGHLRNKICKDFVEVEAKTVMEALRYLAETYKKELKAPLDIGRWRVKVKDFETKESWYVPIFVSELHIYPIFRTAKSNWVQIGVGALLVTAGILMAPASGGTSLTLAKVGSAFLFTSGVAMITNGIMNLLFPVPKQNTSNEASANSKYLGAQGNTVAAGTRIPFGYGLFKISGHYISYNVSSTVIREFTENVQP